MAAVTSNTWGVNMDVRVSLGNISPPAGLEVYKHIYYIAPAHIVLHIVIYLSSGGMFIKFIYHTEKIQSAAYHTREGQGACACVDHVIQCGTGSGGPYEPGKA